MNPLPKKYHSLLVIDDHNMIINGIRLLIGEQFGVFTMRMTGLRVSLWRSSISHGW
ncbi:hypothetical protein ACQ86N_32200 [Puia sp. P3]|uniref:hypothetical protein n=1 Tax=Puia sp. P3 TaxID=3423952 RepID=UPI003D67B062